MPGAGTLQPFVKAVGERVSFKPEKKTDVEGTGIKVVVRVNRD